MFSARVGLVYPSHREICARGRRVGRNWDLPAQHACHFGLHLGLSFFLLSQGCAPAEGVRPAQLIFHAVKFPLLPVTIQAQVVLGGVDPPQYLRL